MLLKGIILHSINILQKERSNNSIYHLLTGKQSIQTIQDAHLFHLAHFYSLYKSLNKEEFDKQLNELINEKYVGERNENSFFVTNVGKEFLNAINLDHYYWNGMKFHQFDLDFYRRLLLFIQVWTNSHINRSRYIPIVDDEATLGWVKQLYRKEKQFVSEWLRKLYDELVHIFSRIDPIYPQLFVRQITTAKTIGLTNEQLAKIFKKSTTDIYLLQINYIHFILQTILSEHEQYPLLNIIVNDLHEMNETKPVTLSAKLTLNYIQKGYSPEEIAKFRQLKINTIYDHIVEIALQDTYFPLESFISTNKQEEVFSAVRKLNSLKLKDIKQAVNDDISYFQIRLALTKLHKLFGEEK